jgi:pimeloyl-ACP methyl ester carboxylesterase
MKEHSFIRQAMIKIFTKFTPFSVVRAAGPLAPKFLRTTRPDIVEKFESIFEDHQKKTVSEYIYHCNNVKTTGEFAFHRLLRNGPWAASPIGEKVKTHICHTIPMTFIYGVNSWIDNSYGKIIKESRPNSYTQVAIVENAGHKVFSDNEIAFNQLVIEACKTLKTSIQES